MLRRAARQMTGYGPLNHYQRFRLGAVSNITSSSVWVRLRCLTALDCLKLQTYRSSARCVRALYPYPSIDLAGALPRQTAITATPNGLCCSHWQGSRHIGLTARFWFQRALQALRVTTVTRPVLNARAAVAKLTVIGLATLAPISPGWTTVNARVQNPYWSSPAQ